MVSQRNWKFDRQLAHINAGKLGCDNFKDKRLQFSSLMLQDVIPNTRIYQVSLFGSYLWTLIEPKTTCETVRTKSVRYLSVTLPLLKLSLILRVKLLISKPHIQPLIPQAATIWVFIPILNIWHLEAVHNWALWVIGGFVYPKRINQTNSWFLSQRFWKYIGWRYLNFR